MNFLLPHHTLRQPSHQVHHDHLPLLVENIGGIKLTLVGLPLHQSLVDLELALQLLHLMF